MTLTFFKNNKPDTRMIEYDQAVVRLGLEKAELESECEKKRNEMKQLGVARDLIMASIQDDRKKLTGEKQKEIDEKSGALILYQEKITEAQKILNGIVARKGELENQLGENNQKLVSIKSELETIENKKEFVSEELKRLDETRSTKAHAVEVIDNSLRQHEKDKDLLMSEAYQLALRKKDINDELETKYTELKELNEIISILQATNKEGLNIVDSFEGERKRLQEKDEFLARKEKDLLLYEKRVEKRAKELGVDIKMTFK